jgi:hypothetical protein
MNQNQPDMPRYGALSPETLFLIRQLHQFLLSSKVFLKGWNHENQGHGDEIFYEEHSRTYKHLFDGNEQGYRSLLSKQFQQLQPRRT